ncbi:MAG: hypothetical protein KF869_15110 [Phycisphaeraceae bacterium]|nr:hypothetical protein [Phycisphaeraceae bacterium]
MHTNTAAPQPNPARPSDTFRIDSGTLIRSVTPRRGTPYEHACTERVYKDAAYAVEQFGARAFTGEEVRAAIAAPSPPFTQVAVAMAFLKERGCIVPARGRRHVAATDYTYEDALIEFHALKDGSPGSAAAAGKDEQA